MIDVLIVDDDADLLMLLELQLRASGHEVRVARTVDEALLASAERRPDLLLLDVHLDGRSGEELVALLDRGLGRPRVLCLLSGLAPDQLAPLADRMGAAHLHKPVDVDALAALLDRAAPRVSS